MADPVPVAPLAPVAVAPAAASTSLIGPLIAGLAALVGVLVLANAFKKDKNVPVPVSPV